MKHPHDKIRRLARLALVALVCEVGSHRTFATQWFVDNTASGANNGSSWLNAWQHFSSITWASVHAGDTVFISGGAGGQTYGGFLNPTADGANGNPITITVGQDGTHSGMVTFDGADGGQGFSYVDFSGRHFITLDGAYAGVPHFNLINLFDTSNRTAANKVYADSSTGVRVQNCLFNNINQCVSLVGATGFNVNHCTGTNIRGDCAVRAVNCPDGGFDSHFVEYNSFGLSFQTNSSVNLGPDGIQASHGITVRYNTIYIVKVGYDTSTQHPDMTQIIGNHVKIYGNYFLNIGDSANDFDLWVNPTWNNVMIYNNLYQITQDIDPFPEFIRIYSSSATMTALSNITIANNTFVDNNSWSNIQITWRGNPTLSNWIIENNNFINSAAYSIFDNTDLSVHPISFAHNVYYPSNLAFTYRGTTYTPATWTVEPTRIQGLPVFTSYTYRSVNNDMHLQNSDTIAKGAALDLSAFFTTDKDGLTRSAPWSVGAYQGPSIPSPGAISLSASAYETSETNANAVITLHRSSGSSGIVGVSYATANGSATAGVNYTSTSGSQSWGNGDTADKNINVPLFNTGFLGQKTFTFGIGSPSGGAILGTTTNSTVFLDGSGTNSTILAGTSWRATSGQISSPFTATGTNYISQAIETDDPAQAGIASYTFTNNIGTNLVVVVYVNAPGDGANSVFVNFNSTPTAPTMISDIYPFTSGFQNYTLNWRGNGSFDNNQFVPNVFNVPLGLQTLYILGREAGVQIAQVTVQAPSGNFPPVTPTNTSPASGATNVSIIPTLVGSAYTDTNSVPSAHAYSQFQIYGASQTTLLWDSGVRGPVESILTPRLDLAFVYYWTCRYQNALGLWSAWSTKTPFQIRNGKIKRVGQLNAGVVKSIN